MKLGRNNGKWEVNFNKLEIGLMAILLSLGTVVALSTIYDAGSTASAIASNMTVAGTLNVTGNFNGTSMNMTHGTLSALAGDAAKITTINGTHATVTNLIGTTTNGTHATITNLIGTTLNSTQATITSLRSTTSNITDATVTGLTSTTANITGAKFTAVWLTNATLTTLNISETVKIPTVRHPTAGGIGQLYYNSTFDCLAYYNSSDWKCSNGTVLVG